MQFSGIAKLLANDKGKTLTKDNLTARRLGDKTFLPPSSMNILEQRMSILFYMLSEMVLIASILALCLLYKINSLPFNSFEKYNLASLKSELEERVNQVPASVKSILVIVDII